MLAAVLLLSGWSLLVRLLPGRGGAMQALVLSLIWGLGETLLSRGPLFWIGVGGSVFPSDPALGLARWCGAGALAALQVFLGWWLWTKVASADRDRKRYRLLGIGVVSLAWLLHGLGAAAMVGIDRPDALLQIL